MASAIDTRFLSPPETPRTYSFPTCEGARQRKKALRQRGTYLGVDGMSDTQRRHDNISEDLRILVLLHSSRRVTWGSGFGCETEGISDRQLREMDILFRRVNCFATEVAVHLLGRDACSGED